MDTNKIIIAYSGSLGYFHPEHASGNRLFSYRNFSINDPSTRSAYYLFLALQNFQKNFPDLANKIVFDFWGLIDKRNIALANEFEINQIVRFEGYLTKDESMKRLSRADAFFLPLESGVGKHQPYALPGKLYEYLKLGKPVLALCEKSECSEILEKAGIGMIHHPKEIDAIVGTLKEIASTNFANRSNFVLNKDYVEQNFDGKVLTKQLVNIFNSLIK